MVVTVEARKLSLPSSFSKVNSSLFDPNSSSLALMHSDSSISIYPYFSPFSIPNFNSLPPPQTLISPPCSSACFVPINNPNPKIQGGFSQDGKRVVFVTAGPHNGGGSRVRVRVCLRFYVLGEDGNFVGATHVVCTQNGVSFDRKLGVIVDVDHGMKVMLSGSVNYLCLYSASGGKVLVFGVKLVGDDGRGLRLIKCAVIDCRLPVSSICLSFGFLIMGEMRGVRVFPLRALVKGRVGNGNRRRVRVRGKGVNPKAEEREVRVKAEGREPKLPNGIIKPFDESTDLDKKVGNSSSSKLFPNVHAYSVPDSVSSSSNVDGTVKPRSLKFRQDSGEWGMQFVLFNDCVHEGTISRVTGFKKPKAVSIQAVSQEKFVILDSNGDLHILQMSKSGSSRMNKLTCTIQVQQLAVFPDASADSQTVVWISDGFHSVHVIMIPSSDNIEKENDGSNNEGATIQKSVTQAIFASENIQDVVPLAANKVLILGQDNLYAYGIS